MYNRMPRDYGALREGMKNLILAQNTTPQYEAPNQYRSKEWMEQIARQKAIENSSLSEREIANRERDRFLMENSPNATAQDLQDFRLNSQGRMTPNTFGQGSVWKELEGLQPSGSTAPNPWRSPPWLEDIAKQKMIEDKAMQDLENEIRSQQRQQNTWNEMNTLEPNQKYSSKPNKQYY